MTRVFTELDPISKLVPSHGWIHDYMTFTSDLEACPRFHLLSACSILGAATNNKVCIYRGDEDMLPKLFPNPWVILLAPPGRGHKTSTINMAVNCLTQACPEARILADKLTPESLVKALSEPTIKERIRIGPRDATGMIKAPELSVFFGKQQYNTGLVSLVTDLYDYREEWSSETIMRGKNILRHNCITIMGGSTPDWLQTMLPEDAFTGGFMSRFVIVEMPPTYFKRRAFPTKPAGVGWDELVKGLRDLSHAEGVFTWTVSGKKDYQQYYDNLKPTGDVQVDAYAERNAEQILKLGMVLSLSQGRMELGREDIAWGRKLLNSLMKETEPRIERLTTHPRMKLVQEIQDELRQHDSLTRKQLLNRTYRGLSYGEAQFHEALRILSQAGLVEIGGEPKNPLYRLKAKGG